MARTSKKVTAQDRWMQLGEELKRLTPHLWAVLRDEEQFIQLSIKLKEDGTTLAVLKRYGSDGGPLVCFGSGYGVTGCLLAIDSTIQGGHWRADKPWSPGR